MRRPGFTLIELMIVVTIIGTLAAIAIPKFADLLDKSRDGATKGNLGRLRSALNIYYGDMEGWYPDSGLSGNQTNSSVLSRSLVPSYIDRIPHAHIKNHPRSNSVYMHNFTTNHTHDTNRGDWGYDGVNPHTTAWGTLWIWCTHTDFKGAQWSTY